MESREFNNITLEQFMWKNEPTNWKLVNNKLEVITDDKKDFWQETWYNFKHDSGHFYYVNIKGDFMVSVTIDADISKLYDQAGLMIYANEKNWLKTGIEFSDGRITIGTVLTNGVSDWATGVFPGKKGNLYLRLIRKGEVLCVKYSLDNNDWILLRLCKIPPLDVYSVGLMCCTPQRGGLVVKFSEVKFTLPGEDILHSN